jgi:hypothetical protein
MHVPLVENLFISSRRRVGALKPNELCAERFRRASQVSIWSDA